MIRRTDPIDASDASDNCHRRHTRSTQVSSSDRQHPDLFTGEEAAIYLHLDPVKGERTLETLRERDGLVGFRIGKEFMYHRLHLDSLIDRIFGIDPTGKRGKG
jgi:hypothetical protein